MKKRVTSRLMALILALGMIFAMSASALASGGIATMKVGPGNVSVPPYQIKIYPNKYTATPTGTDDTGLTSRFQAFQIFSGVVNSSSNAIRNVETGETILPGKLGSVNWGVSVPKEKRQGLLSALVSDTTPLADLGITNLTGIYAAYNDNAGCKTLGDLFKAALLNAKYGVTSSGVDLGTTGDTDFVKAAAVVAGVLDAFTDQTATDKASNLTNAALAEAFAKAVRGHLGDYEAASSWEADTAGEGKNKHWTIGSTVTKGAEYDATEDHLNGGYYIIVDTYAGNGTNEATADTASSDLLVGVFGDVEMNIKASAPTMDKEIVTDGNTETKETDTELGKTITFKLTGTLPENFINYEKYEFTFHDKMSESLTLLAQPTTVTVTVKDPTGAGSIPVTLTLPVGTDNVKVQLNAQHGDEPSKVTHTLDVIFADLKAQPFATALQQAFEAQYKDEKYTGKTVAIDSGSTIVTTYTAYLNASADKTLDGNTNTAYLEYSSNPDNENAKERTTDSKVKVYNFGFAFHKYNGATMANLAGAGFALTKTETGTTYYAILKQDSAGGDSTAAKYSLAGWISEAALKTLLEVDDGEITDAKWTAGIAGSKFTAGEGVILNNGFDTNPGTTNYYISAVTPASGDLSIEGLEGGSYLLNEVVVPTGYDTIAPVPVVFTPMYYGAEVEGKAGTLKSLEVQVGTDPAYKIIDDGKYVQTGGTETPENTDDTYYSDLIARFDVANNPSMWAPGTGGMGTTLIYIAGGALMAGAVVLLILTNRKKDGKRAK